MIKCIALASLVLVAAAITARAEDAPKSALDFKVNTIDGQPADLSQYAGKVVLIVNVASQCGNTPQYKGLEELYEKYKDKGLVVLGFPANEFGAQEPGSNAEISKFCKDNYSVDFPMFSKVVVKGDGITPLYSYLTSPEHDPQKAGPVSWNFEKFLIGRNGMVAARFKPKAQPQSPEVVKAVETELEKK